MAVTLQEIAERAGVSRGTVDRALNNRGRIRIEVAEEIKKIAEEMGYRPNRAGRALAMAKRAVRIGAIVQEVETPFIRALLKGIESAKEEVEYMGGLVTIKQIKGSDAQKTIQAMAELRSEEVYAIAINPTQDQELERVIDRYVNVYDIPIVTMNSDLPNSQRLCYVGQDGMRCGRTGAGLMKEIIADPGSVAIISGYPSNPSIQKRVIGFMAELRAICPEIEVLRPEYTFNDEKKAEDITRRLLDDHPDLRGIFIASNAEDGVCRVLRESYPDREIKLIATDVLEEGGKNLLKHQIQFSLEQDAYVQGFEPVMTLFRLLFDGESPEKEYQYTDINIRTKYNI